MSNLAVALLHYPVYNKHHQVVTTAFTNLDIHDISRTSRTFGILRYYLVTPSEEQLALMQRIVTHWDTGWGADYNPDRREALSIVRTLTSLSDVIQEMRQTNQLPLKIIATGAASRTGSISFKAMRQMIQQENNQYLLLLGTGWGLADDIFAKVDYILEPVQGIGDYNHLPVRSALAIMLDRLLGTY